MDETMQYKIDSNMLSSLAQGNEEAFAAFVHSMYKKFFPFTVSLIKSEAEADDILQEVFVKVWLSRSSLASVENPAAWMHKVVANTASNHLRSELRRELRIKELEKQIIATGEL
ncbi:MAG: RNA polymerase sigma factor [Agriterribacter sp.]